MTEKAEKMPKGGKATPCPVCGKKIKPAGHSGHLRMAKNHNFEGKELETKLAEWGKAADRTPGPDLGATDRPAPDPAHDPPGDDPAPVYKKRSVEKSPWAEKLTRAREKVHSFLYDA